MAVATSGATSTPMRGKRWRPWGALGVNAGISAATIASATEGRRPSRTSTALRVFGAAAAAGLVGVLVLLRVFS